MRSLRERLMAVSAAPKAPPKPPEAPLFCREHIMPIESLGGIALCTLEEVRACDPLFTGDTWALDRLLFLDTETTGLSGGVGTVAFEIGVGFIDARGMVIRQYVMRDYAQEAQMLSQVQALVERADTLITFNGKSFDLPLLESRMLLCRIRLPLTQYPHLDLLHAARRVYKLRLKRCNLSTLEQAVLGHTREDDLPGAQVPARFFDYIKTGEFALLEDVLRHNLQDVVSLAQLTSCLCAAFRAPQQMTHAEDLFGVGRTLERGGHIKRARACYRILGHSTLSPQAHLYLAASYKKEREWAQALDTWRTMIARGEGGITPYIEMAKYAEHVARDMPRALHYAAQAVQYALNTAPLTGVDEAQMARLNQRIKRLQRKNRTDAKGGK